MLFAEYRDDEVWASDFPNELAKINTCGETLEHYPLCSECGTRVTHVSQSSDGKASHFRHCGDFGGGGGGSGVSDCEGSIVDESQEHRAMKSIATSTIEFALETVEVAESSLEVSLDAPYSDADRRQADCLIEFEDRDEQLGDGLIIEVQYKNKSKDIESTTLDYLTLEHDYSVLWLWETDFDTKADLPQNWSCKLVHEGLLRDRVQNQLWPTSEDASIWSNPNGRLEIKLPEPIKTISSWQATTSSPRSARKYIREVADSSEKSGSDAALRGPIYDAIVDSIRKEYDWENLFSPPEYRDLIDEEINTNVIVPVRLTEELVQYIVYRGAKPSNEPERPPNPFDDIQCWKCGTYWWAHGDEQYHYCPNCSAPVDLDWNVATDRIDSKPYYTEHEQYVSGNI